MHDYVGLFNIELSTLSSLKDVLKALLIQSVYCNVAMKPDLTL